MTKRRRLFLFISILIIILIGIWLWIDRDAEHQEFLDEEVIPKDSIDHFWYKNSIIYNLDVKVFQDSDNDGIGDLQGLTNRLGYIDSLGADAIWLAPFQPSPLKDDGYDVADFYAIDEDIGNLEDFEEFIQEAEKRDLKVMMDLVINHTSNEHSWFQKARRDKTSPFRKWYIWSEDKPENQNQGMVFPGVQEEIWTYDSLAGEYYYHRFYKFQPDLNNQHRPVQEEIKEIIKFWMDRGVIGFRLDAVPFIIEIPETEGEEFDRDFEILQELRDYVNEMDEEAIILGEANVKPEANKDYLGDEGLHMMFNFYVNQYMFYALASGKTSEFKDALQSTREIPKESEWGQFLRNHDEVDLDRLRDAEMEKVFEEFGPKEYMQLYDRGIRRRLAPMLNNNRDRLELAYSLLFALPSSPVVRYGDEIGMGDDLNLKERLAVRTPMQWDETQNAGFTQNDTAIRPVIDSGAFSYKKINVKKAKADTTSLLHWTIQMLELRKQCPEISFGKWKTIETGAEEVLGLFYKWEDTRLLLIHNLSDRPHEIILNTDEIEAGRIFDLLEEENINSDKKELKMKLDGYDYKWLRIKT